MTPIFNSDEIAALINRHTKHEVKPDGSLSVSIATSAVIADPELRSIIRKEMLKDTAMLEQAASLSDSDFEELANETGEGLDPIEAASLDMFKELVRELRLAVRPAHGRA